MINANKISFFNSGSTVWKNARYDVTIGWDFTRYTSAFMPFCFFECKMTAFGLVDFGYGCAWSESLAAEKAFSEAWERIWITQQNAKSSEKVNSNGFAAGWTTADAVRASRDELTERAILIQAWREQKGWQASRCYSSRGASLLIALRLKGWKSEFFNICSDVGNVRACLLRHKKHGAIFDAAAGSSLNLIDQKLALSVSKNAFLSGVRPISELPIVGGPEHHHQFYANAENLAAFQFLRGLNLKTEKVWLGNSDAIETKVIVDSSNMPAVSYSTNKYWPELSWGRQSIKGNNLWPHPLA